MKRNSAYRYQTDCRSIVSVVLTSPQHGRPSLAGRTLQVHQHVLRHDHGRGERGKHARHGPTAGPGGRRVW